MGGNDESFENFERNKYLKKLPSMQRIMMEFGDIDVFTMQAVVGASVSDEHEF